MAGNPKPPAVSKAGPGADFVHRLLDALAANAQQQETEKEDQGDRKDLPALKRTVASLGSEVKRWNPMMLTEVICELSLVLWQLRSWFTPGAGFLVVAILEKIAAQSQRLPTPMSGSDPGLAVLRIIEGFVLISVARSERTRDNALRVVEAVVAKKRLPPCTAVRLEAALVCLGACEGRPGVPSLVPLSNKAGEVWLNQLARALRPDAETVAKVLRAREKLETAAAAIFPGCTPEYFGSAVNGFQTQSSDIDCVIALQAEEIEKLHAMADLSPSQSPALCPSSEKRQQRACAAAAVKIMGQNLSSREELGLVVHEIVTEARVPVLKCMSDEGISIDVTFNNLLPLYNSRLLRSYAEFDDRVACLGRLVKWWAKSRHVNDAMEGTLSSYSHCLLVVHFLQRIGLLPNLQDKSAIPEEERGTYGETSPFDGIHDVWFLDPSKLSEDSQLWREWAKSSPHDASLRGLLAAFFRYLAYEWPAHSEVASIRLPGGRVSKEKYFEDMLAAKKAAGLGQETGEAILEPLEPAAVPAGGPDEVEEDEADLDESPLAEKDEDDDEEQAEEATQDPKQSGVLEPPAQQHKLSASEHDLQLAMSTRQGICIDDPMELGRSLGASFQGFERLCFEWRRACHLLQHSEEVEDEVERLQELFSDIPPPPKSLWRLEEQRSFPSIIEKPSRSGSERKVSIKMSIKKGDIGRVMGKGGSTIKELEKSSGIVSIRLEGETESGSDLRIVGSSSEAVEACKARVAKLLSGVSSWLGAPGRFDEEHVRATDDPDYDRRLPGSSYDSWGKSGRAWHPGDGKDGGKGGAPGPVGSARQEYPGWRGGITYDKGSHEKGGGGYEKGGGSFSYYDQSRHDKGSSPSYYEKGGSSYGTSSSWYDKGSGHSKGLKGVIMASSAAAALHSKGGKDQKGKFQKGSGARGAGFWQ
eukprot:TRINITY_DN20857_c0_g1_i1.p1 TRINITY_DN20857_c0_g1~~TRINITY_DN20857_c0_g1_i1.p1  ORF type:complete len:926 (+),score=206.59 TRINITY_DN20857_c0_g1_i1:28-2805(+)